ncbi:alpha/beta hydrolase [Nonomuraea bangladeshensis]|uniref:alpha/beta hydrolase n=1 Tax=Nonomuraea bangladeshensis TaxID=404385 RepID=UPI0031E00725
MIRRLLHALPVAAILIGAWWGYGALTAQSDAALRAQRPVWERCPGSLDVQCARIQVPLDHGAPEEHTIDLALARLPARHPEQRLGSLVVNYGGPGISGVRSFLWDPEPFNGLRARYDIVAFDPRGVGESSPLSCRPSGEPLPYLRVDRTPETPQEITALVKARNEYADMCREQESFHLPHVTTKATARDLDILRSALGESTLNFLGSSYGGGLGAAYAELYPDKVGRMVLDAPATSHTPSLHSGTAVSDESIRAFVEDCAGRPDCPLGHEVDAGLETLRAFVAGLDSRPLDVSGDRLDDAAAVEGIQQLLRDDWPGLRTALAKGLKGDGSPLHAAATSLNGDVFFSRDAHAAISCADDAARPDPEDVARQAEIARRTAPITGALTVWSALYCQGWDPVPGAALPSRLSDGPAKVPPILVVGVDGDPVVPYEGVRELRATLTGSVLVTLRGHGHTAYRSGLRCVNEAVDAYLLEGRLPAADVECGPADDGGS